MGLLFFRPIPRCERLNLLTHILTTLSLLIVLQTTVVYIFAIVNRYDPKFGCDKDPTPGKGLADITIGFQL